MTLEELLDKAFVGKRLIGSDPVADGVVQGVRLDTDYESGWVWLEIYFADGSKAEISQYAEFTLTEVEGQ